MKIVSPNGMFIYFVCDQPNGKSLGIRIERSTGAVGFVSDAPTADQTHPIRFLMSDTAVVHPPVSAQTLPLILLNALENLENSHPEIHAVLSGEIRFEDALHD
jgi:hypothetical protein